MRMSAVAFQALLLIVLPASSGVGAEFSGIVVAIPEGDEIAVRHMGRTNRVRLHGVDSPEIAQIHGTKALQFTSMMVLGREVSVEVLGVNGSGQILGVVILPNKRILNQELVRYGHAWWYRKQAPGDKVLEKLEMDARRARIGLWSHDNPVPPWIFRARLGGDAHYVQSATCSNLRVEVPSW